ncbi:hypothetical protein, partial [Haliea salexigens]|uniref:hypothetical protein n=1 Tax=Haliea salexigens TaxID=287487 RepID=UPI001969E82D
RVGGSGNDQYPDPGWPSWPPHEACSASLQYCDVLFGFLICFYEWFIFSAINTDRLVGFI